MIHLGAEGLDLVQASHVFLLEPLLNPALESQAVNRIHRIGQTRPTYVHKYAISDTIEEIILNGQQQLKNLLNEKDEAMEKIETPQKDRKKRQKLNQGKKDQDFLTLKNIRYLLGISDDVM